MRKGGLHINFLFSAFANYSLCTRNLSSLMVNGIFTSMYQFRNRYNIISFFFQTLQDGI